MDRVDVERLRYEAREHALARPRRPFAGSVGEVTAAGVAMRRYVPDQRRPGAGLVFLHGGYGLFGDLELQDGYCRRTAEGLRLVVLSVAYQLAPEATLDDSVADALTGVDVLAGDGCTQVLVSGDSAGGTVARLAAARSGVPLAGLLLTNPNLDLTLGCFDSAQPGGPDPETSAYAFRAWARVAELADAPALHRTAEGMPRTLLAVGSRDALLPEAQAFAEACRRDRVDCRLDVLDGAEHGFVGTDRADEVIAAARSFFALS